MKYDTVTIMMDIIVTLIVGITILIPTTGFGAEEKQRNRPTQGNEVGKKAVRKSVTMPVYKPPIRGYPKERQCGGSRGSEVFLLYLITPDDHIGLTVREQPTLYWDLLKPIRNRAEFTLIEDQAVHPLLEIDLGSELEAGAYHLSLADYGVRLMLDKIYRWFVSIVLDPEHRSKDFVLEGGIVYTEPEEVLTARLSQVCNEAAPHIYAESGIWYDALSTITDLVYYAPDDMHLKKQRASLIEQVGLRDVAKFEMKSGNFTRQ